MPRFRIIVQSLDTGSELVNETVRAELMTVAIIRVAKRYVQSIFTSSNKQEIKRILSDRLQDA